MSDAIGGLPNLSHSLAWQDTATLRLVRQAQRFYDKARYSEHYRIPDETLTWLFEHVTDLRGCIETVCEEHFAKLVAEAEREVGKG